MHTVEPIPFQGVEKGAVVQERRVFNETPVDPRKCCHLMTKVLYLLNNGIEFTAQEATDLFFASTKLFQSNDVRLLAISPSSLPLLLILTRSISLLFLANFETNDLFGAQGTLSLRQRCDYCVCESYQGYELQEQYLPCQCHSNFVLRC